MAVKLPEPTLDPLTEAAATPRRRRPPWLRIFVSLALIAYLSWGMQWSGVIASLGSLRLGWFGVALLSYLAGQMLCAYKWRLLGQAIGLQGSYGRYWLAYFSGMFMNLFLPTSVGGDVGRSLMLANGRQGLRPAIVSVLADRGTGLLALSWVALAAERMLVNAGLPDVVRWSIWGLAAALTLGCLLPFLAPRWLDGRGETLKIANRCWRSPARFGSAVGMSLIFQAGLAVVHGLLGQAMGLNVPWGYYFLVSPLAALAAMMPISIYGLGFREGALVLLLGLRGIEREAALGFGVAWLLLVTLLSLVGGAILAVTGGVPKLAENNGAEDD